VISLIDEIDLKIAELSAMQPYTEDRLDTLKRGPNVGLPDDWDDDYDPYDND
jgi:hypothetical protein